MSSKKRNLSKIIKHEPDQVKLTALNQEQKEVLRSISENQVTIIHGYAGTGKSYLATAYGLLEFLQGKYERLIFTRPCIPAYGEDLGFLPLT